MLKWQKIQIPCNTGYAVYFRFRFTQYLHMGGKLKKKFEKKIEKKISKWPTLKN